MAEWRRKRVRKKIFKGAWWGAFRVLRESHITIRPSKEAASAFFFVKGFVTQSLYRPAVAVQFCTVPDIFWAMDIPFYTLEIGGVLLAGRAQKFVQEMIDLGEDHGVHKELCTAGRGFYGPFLNGLLIPPIALVNNGQTCDSSRVYYQLLKKVLPETPSFQLDIPYTDDERAQEYAAGEIKRLVSFLEKVTNKKLDYDRLKEVVEESNRANEYALEANELRKSIPCPQPYQALLLSYLVRMYFSGHPVGTYLQRLIRDDAVIKMNKADGKEKHRVVLWYTPTFHTPLKLYEEWLRETFGARIVMDYLGFNAWEPIDTSSPDSIFKGLAKRCMNVSMARQSKGIGYFIGDLVRIYDEYKADCVIYPGHVGCKNSWGAVGLAREVMKKRFGAPFLSFEMDIADARVTSEEEIKNKIARFFETVF